MGANPCLPYNFCLESMGGLDPDFLSWEQGYNCGHSNPIYELVGHVAASSKNKALAHFVSSGSFTPKCNASSSSPAHSDSEWLPSADLTEWLPTIVDVADARNHLHRYFSSKGGSAAQYTATWRWKGMGGYGFNSWANNDECHFTDEATGSEVKGCSGASAGDNCALKFFSAER